MRQSTPKRIDAQQRRHRLQFARRERCSYKKPCFKCLYDQSFLRASRRPSLQRARGKLRIVELFCGCGGMTAGFVEAARRCSYVVEVPLAVDTDPLALDIFKANMPDSWCRVADVSKLFGGRLGTRLTTAERKLKRRVRRVDVLLGGPPCQGHSDLNNHTRRSDPKNRLFSCMARAAEVLAPKVVIIENVPPVKFDSNGVVAKTEAALRSAGYLVASDVVPLDEVGVPQTRRRFIMIASRVNNLNPEQVLARVRGNGEGCRRTVRWAIEDLVDVATANAYDNASTPTDRNRKRIDFLFDHDVFELPNEIRPKCHQDGNHSYVSVYGRMKWDRPAQTITTGFGCMGQGRYVHPLRRRTITAHEAARLQTFPDWYNFGADRARTLLAKTIGNAVPPFLTLALGNLIIPLLFQETRKSRY